MLSSDKYLVGANPSNPKLMGVAACLDNFLVRNDSVASSNLKIRMTMNSWIDLSEIFSVDISNVITNVSNFKKFSETVVENFQNKIHETTDHLILMIHLETNGGDTTSIAFVSLENSVRSTASGVDFGDRWPVFLKLFSLLKEHNVQFIFASEAGRDVFDGVVKFTPDKKTLLTLVKRKWTDMIQELEEVTGFKQICLSMNNDNTFDGKVLSFGVALFVLDGKKVSAEEVHFHPKNSFGSGFVKLKITLDESTSITIMGVHFPLNFAKDEKENPLTDVSEQLNKFAFENEVDIIFGDFNTIISNFDRFDVVKDRMTNFEMVVPKKCPTFFSSWCDNEVPVEDIPSLSSIFE